MEIAVIVAVAQNGVIGRAGALPWHLPGDLRRFRERTMGHHVVMGRRTWASIGRPLPGRTNVVLSRNTADELAGCKVVRSLASALQLAREAGEREVFIIGGAEVYREALPLADRVYLTQVAANPEGDAFFDPLVPDQWQELARETHPRENDRPAYDIVTFVRTRALAATSPPPPR